MRNRNRFITAIFLSSLALSACGTSMPSAYSGGGSVSVMEPSTSDMGMVDTSGKSSGISSTAVAPANIRSGDLTLETGNVEKVFNDVKNSVSDFGGRVETSNFQGRVDGYGPNAYLTIRVPESKLDAAVETVSKLGKRTSLSINTSDVTLQTVDLQAKVDALVESESRLQALLAKTSSTAELISGEQALATIRADLDSYKSQLDYLKNQVAESTLNVQIVSNDSSVTSGLKSFKEIVIQATRGFLNAFQNSFVFIITAIPWVLVIGILFVAARFTIRRISQLLKRKKENQ